MPLPSTRIASAGLLGGALTLLLSSFLMLGSTTVPTEVQMPGTQPNEAGLGSPDGCLNCHAGFDDETEPGHQWRGSMMAHAARDPVFWSAVAIAEQDYPGSGDYCLRCHIATGWLGGRSEPTDGSAMLGNDADGVTCNLCHALTNPDQSEHLGIQNAPFIANDGLEGFYGAGMYVVWGGSERLGPYADPVTPHGWLQSSFHRQPEMCGTCHDVSNPVTGDLAHNNGAQVPLAPGQFSGVPGGVVTDKAAFKNPPYKYGVVERTFSEHRVSALSTTRVADYPSLPADLQGGALQYAYDQALASTVTGDYVDGTTRYFSCQSCHMPPVTGVGAGNPGTPTRTDLPKHDLTGSNYWVPDAIQYLDGNLTLGNGLSPDQIDALNDGKVRAVETLERAATMSVSGNTLKVVNHTGHKLITGYPEGRRMWLNIEWYDVGGVLLREDGEYGTITAMINGSPTSVETLLDLSDPNTKSYEAHHGMTQEWASQLIAFGTSASLPLTFDRTSGAVVDTLGSLAASAPGTELETFHFVLNNTVLGDTRIPPYGFPYDDARERNMLPVPDTQYGNPGSGGTYNYWDDFVLNPPVGAAYASIDLLFQPTSWEYIQFLDIANDGSVSHLANEGDDLLDAWLNTGMAAPVSIASADWTAPDLFTDYCFGDGTGTACPCGNNGNAGHGCDNAQGTGGVRLTGTGLPAFNNVLLHGAGFPAATTPTVIVIRGDASIETTFGDGLLCVNVPVVRFGATFAQNGFSSHQVNHGAGPGSFYYQLWYRNTPITFCNSEQAFNLSNGLQIDYP